ncbi:MAG: helix-turn-helix domain-containing protein [Aeromonas sp.]
MTVNLNTVGGRLRHLRSVLGMNREKFAKVLGIPTNTIKHYEIGGRRPSYALLKAIADSVVTCHYYDWLMHNRVDLPVQLDPVTGGSSVGLLAQLIDAADQSQSGDVILPATLVEDIRSAILRSGIRTLRTGVGS